MSTIAGNMIGSYSQIGKTLILTDESGNEYTGVITDKEVIFTANPATDIREGVIAATDEGVVIGSAFIPNYKVYTGTKVVTNGNGFVLYLPNGGYNYKKLQAIICSFNTSVEKSVSAEQIVVEDQVFAVQSTEPMAYVIKDSENVSIDFGMINNSGNMYLLRYFLYEELY